MSRTKTNLEKKLDKLEIRFLEMSTFMLARYLKIYKWADLFSKIIENPNVTEKDLCYEEEKSGNNPIMIAAKLRHKDLVKMSCE